MNRTQYRQARRMIRDNGRSILGSFKGQIRKELDILLFNIQDSKDDLAERQDIVSWCNRSGISYTFRNLAK